jgi:hypothetical protein
MLLRFKMLGDASGLTKGTRQATTQLKGLGKTTDKISRGMKSALGGLGAGLAFGGIVSFLKQATQGAELARQADARVLQVAKSMKLFGGETGAVADRLSEYADKMELTTGQTAETTKQVQATLLTFKAVGKTAKQTGGIFDRATIAAADLAAAGFGTAESNAKQLGKALSDPIKGLTALTRAGVTFTDAEKKKIKTLVESNREAEAQVLILKAIEDQVGGVAEKTALSSEKLENAFGQISDQIGAALLPYLDQLATFLTSDEGQKQIKQLADQFVGLVEELGKLGKWILENKDLVATMATVFLGLKLGAGIISGYKTLKTIWEGLVKAGKLIKPPTVGTGGAGLPTTTPAGGKPNAPAKPNKINIPPALAVTAAAAISTALVLAIPGSTDRNVAERNAGSRERFWETKRINQILMGGRGGLAPGVTRRPGEYSPYSLGGIPITQGKSTFNYQITVNGTKLTGAEIAAAIKKYDRQRGKTGTGGFVDLG